MKKFLPFLAICFVFVAMGLDSNGLMQLAERRPDARYSFYVPYSVTAAIPNSEIIKNGNSAVISCPIASAPAVKQNLKRVSGESLRYPCSSLTEEMQFLLSFFDVRVINSYDVDGLKIVEGFTRRLGNGINIDGSAINIQIAVGKGYAAVGTPIILGGY